MSAQAVGHLFVWVQKGYYPTSFFHVLDDIHQPSFHMHVVYIASNIFPLQMEAIHYVCLYVQHPGYMV